MENNFLKELFKKYNHVLLLLYYPIIFTVFFFLEKEIVPEYFMHSKFDDYIPFVPVFVIPYFLWFAYIPATLTFLGLKSRDGFIKLCFHMFIGMTISYIIYWLYPNGIKLRETADLSGNDIFTSIVRWLYGFDTPTNSNPSMHVLNAIAIHLAIVNYNWTKHKGAITNSSFVLMILIIISTVTLKQHSAIDVMYGALIAVVLYVAVYKINYVSLWNSVKDYLHNKKEETMSKEP